MPQADSEGNERIPPDGFDMVKLHFTREPLHQLRWSPSPFRGGLCNHPQKHKKRANHISWFALFCVGDPYGNWIKFFEFSNLPWYGFYPVSTAFFSFNVFYNPVLYRNFSERVKDRQRTTLCAYSCYYHFKSRNTFLNTVKFTVICDNGGNNHEQI